MTQGIVMKDIYIVCKKRMKTIILVVLLFTIAGVSISFAIPATYQVKTDILVNYSTNISTTSLSEGEINNNLSLIGTYKYFLQSNRILQKVNEVLKEPYDLTEWENKVRIESSRESQIISIVVQDVKAEKAAIVANNIASIFQQEVKNVMKQENVNVLSKVSAKEDTEMVKPPTVFYLLISFCIGILVIVMYIILKETYFTIVDSGEKVRRYLNLSNLGTIPFIKKPQRNREIDYEDNLLQHFGVNENISEVFKTIRANLQFLMKQQNVKTLLITSSNSEDGKSFVGANLAKIIAMTGKKTVYIDADFRKPRGRILFNIKNNLGIMSYFTGYSTFPNIIQKTEFDHLSFIGSGPLQPNSREISSSFQMKEIIEQLKQQFDVIIIDSPSLIFADTLNLATIVDGCIFVINARKTRKEQAKESVNQLTKIKVKMIVTVLNKGKKVKRKTEYY